MHRIAGWLGGGMIAAGLTIYFNIDGIERWLIVTGSLMLGSAIANND